MRIFNVSCKFYHFIYLFLGFFAAFVPLSFLKGQLKSGQGRDRGNDMQQRVTMWNRTRGHCSEDTASVYGVPALPTEPPGAPVLCY